MNIVSPCARKGNSGFTWTGGHLLKEGATNVKPPAMARYGSKIGSIQTAAHFTVIVKE